MSEGSLLIFGGKRGRGRPKSEERLTPVTTWIPPAYAQRLDAMARKHGVHVSELVRNLLTIKIDTSK